MMTKSDVEALTSEMPLTELVQAMSWLFDIPITAIHFMYTESSAKGLS